MRKHNLDRLANHLLIECGLSLEETERILDVADAQIEQNQYEQRKKELLDKSRRDRDFLKMAEESRIIKDDSKEKIEGESLIDYANRNRIIK